MKRGKLKTYVTRIRGTHTTFKSKAFSKGGALKQVWAKIRGGYRYDVDSYTELKRRATTERVD